MLKKSKPPLSTAVTERAALPSPARLLLTRSIAFALLLLVGFGYITQSVLSRGPITRIDAQVMKAMPSVRTHVLDDVFRFISLFDSTVPVVALVLVSIGILWYKSQRLVAVTVVITVVLEELLYVIPKHIVHRARPDAALSVYSQSGFSFPSGHAMRATVLNGLVAYLLTRSFTSMIARACIITGYLVSVALVSFSRVYLGVHYVSDVLASIFLGGAFLILIICGIEIVTRYGSRKQAAQSFKY